LNQSAICCIAATDGPAVANELPREQQRVYTDGSRIARPVGGEFSAVLAIGDGLRDGQFCGPLRFTSELPS
jgi:hypothetical protein